MWTQQSTKLVGLGAEAGARQGFSVSISGDGNTVFVGGPNDNNSGPPFNIATLGTGAAWVFTAADLTITKSHIGDFRQGDTGDKYTITVTNSGSAAFSGTATVIDDVPAGLTPVAPNAAVDGWSCSISGQTLTCERSDPLESGASYPAISLMVNVANSAPAIVTNTATVSAGGEVNTANDTAYDVTTIISSSAPFAPTGVTATAISITRVDVAWSASAGATSYQIERRAAGGGFSQIGTSLTSIFSDSTASADSAYLYRIRAVNNFGVSFSSSADLATTVIFVDSPLTPGVLVKAIHLSQIRTAVNAVRLLAGLQAASFTDTATTGTRIRAVHVSELRSNLDAARGALGLSTGGYTDASLSSVVIKAIHFQELRNRVQ